MTHRKSYHSATVAVCRNFLTGTCGYTADACWWNHQAREISSDVKCFVCSKVFKTNFEMMNHKKITHSDSIQMCTKFLQGNCQFQDNFCWFKHSQETVEDGEDDDSNAEKDKDTPSAFQEAERKTKPPSKSPETNQN